MRKLYEIPAYNFLMFLNNPDAQKFKGSSDTAFVDMDDEEQSILCNYEGHPEFESGGAELSHDFETVKRFVEKYGTRID